MPEGKFTIGGYWLDSVPNSRMWYRFWYDPGSGTVSRATLKEPDFERAKIALAAFVIKEGGTANEPVVINPADGRHPRDVLLISVFNHYWENHSEKRRDPWNAKRAGNLLLDYLDRVLEHPARVSDLTKARQEAYMRHCAETHRHSVNTISRGLSIVNAAINFAVEPVILKRDGRDVEVRLLTHGEKVYYNKAYVSEVTSAPMPRPRNWIPTMDVLAAFVEDIRQDHLFRYVVLALNTWARPEAICDLGPFSIERQHGLINLNPAGRRQTKKFRPTVPLTENLSAWIREWEKPREPTAREKKKKGKTPKPAERYVVWNDRPVKTITKTFYKHRNKVDKVDGKDVRRYPDELTRYALRHLMTTVAIRAGVPEEQRERWLGHVDEEKNWYGIYEPDFLSDARRATDEFMLALERAIENRAHREGRAPRRSVVALKPLASPTVRRIGLVEK